MIERRRMYRRGLACAALMLLVGCGKSDADKGDIAKALAGGDLKTTEHAEKGMADLKAKAEEKAAKAKNDELERVTANPTDVPDIEAACADAGAAFDEYKQKRIIADELGRWNATKEPDIKKVVEACKQNANPRVAACEANALRGASVAHFGPDSAGELIDYCRKRWGDGSAAPAGEQPADQAG